MGRTNGRSVHTVQDRVTAALPLVLTAWVALPFIRLDRWVTGFDTVAYSGPNLVVSITEIRNGRIPQWNGNIFGGVTHVGNAPAAVFEPLMWLASPLPFHRALAWIVAAHLMILALGMWWVLRRSLRLAMPAAALGTVAVVGSGLVMSRSIQFEQIAVVAWIPWVLVGCDLSLRGDGTLRRLVVLPLSVALLAVSGHPQQVYIAVPLVALWCVGRFVDHGADGRGIVRVAAGGVLALGLAAAHLLPTGLAVGDSALLDARSIESAGNPAYSAQPTLLPATVLGDVTAETHPFTSGGFEAMAFLGAVAGALALLGALTAWRRADRWTAIVMVAAAAFGGLCALGPRTPAFRALHRFLPGFDLARVPGRWMLLVTFALAILAAIGADQLATNRIAPRRIAVASAALVAVLVTTWAGPFVRSSTPGLVWWAVAFAIVIVGAVAAARSDRLRVPASLILLTLATIELGVMSNSSLARLLQATRPFTELGDEITDHLDTQPGRSVALTDDRLGEPEYLIPSLRPNANAALGVASLDGYDGGTQVTRRWADAISALAAEPLNPELTLRAQMTFPVSPEISARLGVRWLLVETASRPLDVVAPEWGDPVRRSGSRALLENPAWVAEASVLHRTRSAPADSPAGTLRTTPADTAVVEDTVDPVRCSSRCEATAATVRMRRNGAIDITIPADTSAGILVVDEQISKGWHATVDGESASLVEANGMFIGVEVPEGARQVELRYSAPGLRLGLLMSALAALGVGALLVPTRFWSRVRAAVGRDAPET